MSSEVAEIVQRLAIMMPIFLLSLSVHEAAHAIAANYLGDPTARLLGRITLNPKSHIDLLGTIIIPGLGAIGAFGGIGFIGWAKPVPVNPLNFKDMRRDDTIVAVAGPASNIALSFCFFLAYFLLFYVFGTLIGETVYQPLAELFRYGIYINIGLAVFNMLPVPPLDGSHVVANLLPHEMAEKYRSIGFYGIIILLLLINLTPLSMVLGQIMRALIAPYSLVVPL